MIQAPTLSLVGINTDIAKVVAALVREQLACKDMHTIEKSKKSTPCLRPDNAQIHEHHSCGEACICWALTA